MNKQEIVHKVKCKLCETVLTDDIHALQKCKFGKLKFDTGECEYYTRIIGNEEDYEIIK